MGKARRGRKEYSKEQELKYENSKLRREVGSLRKQLARLDLDRHSYVRDIVDEHLAEEKEAESAEKMVSRLKEEWHCKKCSEGYLEIVLYQKMHETWYFRKCSNLHCVHRTKSQIYSSKVKGIKNDTSKQNDIRPKIRKTYGFKKD